MNGVSTEEAKKRLVKHGYYEVPEKKTNHFLRFASKFWDLTSWMFESATVMELVLGKYLESYVIVVLLVFNAVVSFIQEGKPSLVCDFEELYRYRLLASLSCTAKT